MEAFVMHPIPFPIVDARELIIKDAPIAYRVKFVTIGRFQSQWSLRITIART